MAKPDTFSNEGKAHALKGNMLRRWIRGLGSVRFAIGILVALALASIFSVLIGEWVPQGQADAFYIHRFGERMFHVYRVLGIVDPYGSWWFSGLLGLLGLSLMVCSVRRLRSTLVTGFGADLKDDPAQVMRSPLRRRASLPIPTEQGRDRIRDLLRGKRYRISEQRDGSRVVLFASRGGIARLGAPLTHAGILLLLVAGIVVGTRSYRVTEYGAPGDVLSVSGRSFRIRVDSVDLETAPNGNVEDYLSTLTVLDPDSVVTKTIQVNDPLHYDGIDVYQSEFSKDSRRIENALIWVMDRDTGARVAELQLPFQESVRIADLDLSLRVDEFVPDFVIGEGGRVGSRSTEHRNPAIKLTSSSGDDEGGSEEQWLFFQYPETHMKHTGPYRFRPVDYRPAYITGLQIAMTPARGLVWSGFGICTLGIFLAFYVVHRRIWVVLEPEGDEQCKATIGGSSNKSRDTFEREFRALIAALKE